MVISELDSLNDQYYKESVKAVGSLVDLKVGIHKHDKVLDDKIEDFKGRLGVLDSNS
jgi:hypothetical protein